MPKLLYHYFSPEGLKKNKPVSNSSRLVLKEAEKCGIAWHITPGTQIITLTYKGEKKSYYHQVPSSTTALAKYACNNKQITINLLRQAGITVPRGYRIKSVDSTEYCRKIYDELQKPLVVKPTNGTWGENITVNITTFAEFVKAIEVAQTYAHKDRTHIIAEEMFSGDEYRVLLTQKKVIGILKRVPANVIGNGTDTIKKLIIEKNKEPIRGNKNEPTSHLKIRMDTQLKKNLIKQGLTLESVPPESKRIFLRSVSNISQGGDAIDVTDQAHPSVSEIALKAINALPGLSFAGLDFMTKDITKPQKSTDYVIIEINDSPGFDIHDYPYKGKNRHAARAFLELIFPNLEKN